MVGLKKHNFAHLVLLLVLLLQQAAWASNETDGFDLTMMSLEELMEVEVVSLFKKKQRLMDAAAAVFVISQDDIRRSGATNIPEVLRMVPGVHVARIESSKWAVTARGFNGRFANKLLVLIDGRSIYSPFLSGVYWEQQDVLLEDVDRIEVIRGPGASLWGANAVNGVINIVTKNAEDTTGFQATAGGGNEERAFGSARYGFELGERGAARIYAKYLNRDDLELTSGGRGDDEWNLFRTGFRSDLSPNDDNELTLIGDGYFGELRETVFDLNFDNPDPEPMGNSIDTYGFNFLARWNRILSPTSDISLQTYYDRNTRNSFQLPGDRHNFDIDFQHTSELMPGNTLLWGLGYRFGTDDFENNFESSLDTTSRDMHQYSAFIQDEQELFKNQLRLIAGMKFELNEFSGFEYQPTVRASWTPNARHTVWGAFSRAVRIPTRAENDLRLNIEVIEPNPLAPPGTPPTLISIFGKEDFESETVLAYELGYRIKPKPGISLDFAVFYNFYDNIRSASAGQPFLGEFEDVLNVTVPINADNMNELQSYGLEFAGYWQALDYLAFNLAYSYSDFDYLQENNFGTSDAAPWATPRHEFSLRTQLDLPMDIEVDAWLRYTSAITDIDIDGYVNLDMRLAKKFGEHYELALVGQNLLEDSHQEFTGIEFVRGVTSEVERSFYLKATLNF
jgi:iron complex outermembrane receptor protein